MQEAPRDVLPVEAYCCEHESRLREGLDPYGRWRPV